MHNHIITLTPRVSLHQTHHWHTNSGIIFHEEGVLLVDPGIYTADLQRIAALVRDRTVIAGLVTHAHWDHILWYRDFGAAVPRYASPATLAVLTKERVNILAELDAIERDEFKGVEQWERSLLFCEHELSHGSDVLARYFVDPIPLEGHCAGQTGFWLPEERVFFAGDTLSDVEVPTIEPGSNAISSYLDSLSAMESIITQVDWVVPGHGSPANPDEAKRRLDQDRSYLQHLQAWVPPTNSKDLTGCARALLAKWCETRAATPETFGMHLENLRVLSQLTD